MANPTFRPIVRAWNQILRKAHEFKNSQFQHDADQAMRFFDGPYDWLYNNQYGTNQGPFQLGGEFNVPRPTFRMTMNKAAEVVQLYGPSLYARNPHRQITMRRQSEFPLDMVPDPTQQQMIMQQLAVKHRIKEIGAELMQEMINYTPHELDLRLHSRRAVDEALITGMGVTWTEPFRPPGSPYMFIGSFHDTVDNLIVDPDMETIQHAKWIARRRVRPKWEVAAEFGIPMDDLRGSVESSAQQGTIQAHPDYQFFRQQGETNDLMVYFEIYSRMGLGHRMHWKFNKHLELASDVLDDLGENVRILVSDDYDYPLNVPEKILNRGNMDEIRERLQWPTPFYLDPTDPWPFAYLAFHERPRKVWPMSHLKPGLGELSFLNWAFSFLADKVKNTSRDFIATLRSLDEDVKANLLGGTDLTLLEFEKTQGNNINDIIQFLQHPPFNKDLVEVIQMIMKTFEERVGLNELMYGTSKRQLRSAAEANVKSESMRIRPDDMAECVEAWSTKQARKEAIATYWHSRQEDVLPVLGEERALLYAQTVMQMDVREVIHEFNVRIEAGSVRKPNRDRDLQNVNTAIQVWGPVVQAYSQMTGDFEPLNFLAAQWEKVNEMEPRGIQFQPPPPPEPDQAAAQEAQMDMEIKAQEHEMKMVQGQQAHQQKLTQQLEQAQLKQDLEVSKGVSEQQKDQQKHVQELTQDQQKHLQELGQDQQQFLLDLLQAKAEGTMDLFLKKMMGTVEVANKAASAKAQAKPTESNGKSKPKPKPKMTPEQKKAMEDKEIRRMIDEYSKLFDMNREEIEQFTEEMMRGR